MLRVADIMTKEVFTIDMETSVEEASWAFARRRIGGAPVLDLSGRVAGFLSKSDIVDPSWNDWVDRNRATAGDLMFPGVLALHPEAPALDAVVGMASRNIHHVMVVDRDLKLVGIVTSLDVVKALARGLRLDEPSPLQPTAVAQTAA